MTILTILLAGTVACGLYGDVGGSSSTDDIYDPAESRAITVMDLPANCDLDGRDNGSSSAQAGKLTVQ